MFVDILTPMNSICIHVSYIIMLLVFFICSFYVPHYLEYDYGMSYECPPEARVDPQTGEALDYNPFKC